MFSHHFLETLWKDVKTFLGLERRLQSLDTVELCTH